MFRSFKRSQLQWKFALFSPSYLAGCHPLLSGLGSRFQIWQIVAIGVVFLSWRFCEIRIKLFRRLLFRHIVIKGFGCLLTHILFVFTFFFQNVQIFAQERHLWGMSWEQRNRLLYLRWVKLLHDYSFWWRFVFSGTEFFTSVLILFNRILDTDEVLPSIVRNVVISTVNPCQG